MDFDLNTREGMDAAIAWTLDHLRQIKDGGFWGVPRSGLILRIYRTEKRVVVIHKGLPDPAIKRVIEVMGWTYEE